MSPDALEREIDGLYRLPTEEFVAARNALAKALRTEGHRDASDRVKSLRRATRTAWAVNRVVQTRTGAFAEARDAGEAVRGALSGEGSLQDAMARRRTAIDRLTRLAETELVEAGGSSGPDAVRRIGRTLEALVTVEDPDIVPGRLTGDLDPPGFDAVVGLALGASPSRPMSAGRSTRKKTRPRKTRADAGEADPSPPSAPVRSREQVAALRAEVADAQKALDVAERARAAAERAATRTARARANAQAELERATEDSEAAESRLEEAREAVAARAAELARARARLEGPHP